MSLNLVSHNSVGVSNNTSKVLNSDWYKLIFELQTTIVFETFDFFKQQNCVPALLPVTTGSVTSPMGLGSDSLPVCVNLFNQKTYLADSMQFHLEYLLRLAHKGVFYIMPTFRGEDHDKRHLNQFFHIEAEIKGTLTDIISLINKYLKHLLNSVYINHKVEITNIVGSTKHIESALELDYDKRKIKFKDAVSLLGPNNKQYFDYSDGHYLGLSREGENELLAISGHGIWVTHMPKIGVPFYQDDADDNVHSMSADFLAGIGEIIGCGQRHTTSEATIRAMRERDVNPSEYEWYLEMKKDFPMLTSGFGLGLERLLLWILKHDDIRDIPLIARLKGFNSIP